MNGIYEWLREKQTVTSPSGLTYEVARLKDAADEIEAWRDVARSFCSALLHQAALHRGSPPPAPEDADRWLDEAYAMIVQAHSDRDAQAAGDG